MRQKQQYSAVKSNVMSNVMSNVISSTVQAFDQAHIGPKHLLECSASTPGGQQ